LSFLAGLRATKAPTKKAAPAAATNAAPAGIAGYSAPQPPRVFRPKKGVPQAQVPVFNPAGIVEGAGPEQDQMHHARLSFNAATMGVPVVNGTMGGRPITRVWWDAPPAQTFPSRIRLKDLTPPAGVDAMVGTPHLPGRVDLPAVWDGEPSGAAPNVQGYF
jgi:hypothetical protein